MRRLLGRLVREREDTLSLILIPTRNLTTSLPLLEALQFPAELQSQLEMGVGQFLPVLSVHGWQMLVVLRQTLLSEDVM